ncbi:MAG: M48 family metallopeptidase [Hyphomicrobiaceae bacterium]|jgi:predicted metal-dependent hydrolase
MTRRSNVKLLANTSDLNIQGLNAPIEFRHHPCARRITLRISQTRRAVIVTIPPRCRLADADRFFRHNIDWVRERLGDLPQPLPFADGVEMPVRGVMHQIRFTGTARAGGVVRVETAGAVRRLLVSGRREHAPRRLKDWLLAQALQDLDACVLRHAAALGVRARRISLRDQTSRWGSCSSTGLLSFSWRLILAPPAVLDYVAAHEVAHLAEMNHGPRFWKLVARAIPSFDEARRWLTLNGATLHRYGCEPDAAGA